MTQETLKGGWDYHLVALSIVISILASWAAVDLTTRVAEARGRQRNLWLACGAFAMGLGIWTMHYVGMLAWDLPVPVRYDWPTVLFSLQSAIAASAVALYVASRERMGFIRAGVGGLFMGAGISAMHYIGMEAMRLPAMCEYSTPLLTVSVIIGILISFCALWLTFSCRGDSASPWHRAASVLLMGIAIPAMHYTGMAAVSYHRMSVAPDLRHAIEISGLGIVTIVIFTAGVLGIAIVSSAFERRVAAHRSEVTASEHRQLVEAAREILWRKSATSPVFSYVNRIVVETFGYPVQQWRTQPNLWQDSQLPEDRERAERHLAAAAGGQGAQYFEHRMHAADGSVVWLRTTICLADSSVLIGVSENVTEIKRAQEAAEAGSRAKSQFLANMSHELRTPLNAIIGYSDMLVEEATEQQLTQFTSDLGRIRASGRQLLSLINDVLDLARIEAGRVELCIEEFGLRDMITDVSLIAEPLAARNSNSFSVDCCDARIESDAVRLRQILLNLIGNACKFTDQGTVQLIATLEPDVAGNFVKFQVKDSGIGMTTDQLDRIFEVFSQADSSTARRFGGTGLGLAITKKFSEILNGRIEVESAPGRGTTFSIWIPEKRPSPPLLPVIAPRLVPDRCLKCDALTKQ